MPHTPNMYGSNLKEYAQHILDNKQIAVSTRGYLCQSFEIEVTEVVFVPKHKGQVFHRNNLH